MHRIICQILGFPLDFLRGHLFFPYPQHHFSADAISFLWSLYNCLFIFILFIVYFRKIYRFSWNLCKSLVQALQILAYYGKKSIPQELFLFHCFPWLGTYDGFLLSLMTYKKSYVCRIVSIEAPIVNNYLLLSLVDKLKWFRNYNSHLLVRKSIF